MTVSVEAARRFATSVRQHEDAVSGFDDSESSPPENSGSLPPGQAGVLKQFLDRLPVLNDEERWGLDDAMDEVQMASKLWLIDELDKCADVSDKPMVVVGAWYGVLPLLMNWRMKNPPPRMLCIDIDHEVLSAGERLIGPLYENVEFRLADAMTFDYETFGGGPGAVVVNTICEHLPQFDSWWKRIPNGHLVVLQSNNYFLCPDHVNAVDSLEEMKEQAPMSRVLFEGALPLLKWKRFMLIGHR